MAIMEGTLYLPAERLNFRNYPEVATLMGDIKDIIRYSIEVGNAIKAYTSSTLDRINLNIVDLQRCILLCRTVCSTLGLAPNVCYDLLVEIRSLQNTLQTLVFVKNRYGSQYIGVPTNLTIRPSIL